LRSAPSSGSRFARADPPAGLPNLPREALDLDALHDPEAIVWCCGPERLAPRRQLAYHAISAASSSGEAHPPGDRKTIRAVLRRGDRRPLGLRWLGYGVRPQTSTAWRNYLTSRRAAALAASARALGIGFAEVPRCRTTRAS